MNEQVKKPNETNIILIWKCRRLFPINLRETVNYIFDESVGCHEMCVRARPYLLRLFDIDMDIIMHVYAFTSSSASLFFLLHFPWHKNKFVVCTVVSVLYLLASQFDCVYSVCIYFMECTHLSLLATAQPNELKC